MAKAKSSTKKKVSKKKSTTAKRKVAASKTGALTKKLREDLKTTKETFNVFKAAAKVEIKLAKEAAKAEMAVLKDQLDAALKRERELVKLAEGKVRMMVSAGDKWEKEQMAKIKKMGSKKKKRK